MLIIPYHVTNTIYLFSGANLGCLFGCHDRPLCTAGTQHQSR